MSEHQVRAALLLAAGPGERMRSQRPQPLHRVGGATLLERCIRVLRKAGIERIVTVLGFQAEQVNAAIEKRRLPVEVIVNPDWETGSASSVLTGLSVIDDRRCLVVPVDHIFEADDVRRLIDTETGNVAAVHHNGQPADTEGRVQLNPDGSVACLGTDLSEYDAVDAGLSVVEVQDVLAVSYRARKSWLEVRQQMLAHGYPMRSEEVNGLWADVDTPEEVRKLERSLWRRLGRKPTDGVITRVLNRHISGPLTRLLLHTRITPDAATALAFLVTLAAAALVATGDSWLMVAGGIGVILGSALDGVDGEIARITATASRHGAALDTLLDRYADLAVVLALVLAAGATATVWAWGFAAAAGCLLVSYIHAVGRDTDVRLLFRREFRLLIFAVGAIAGVPLWGLVVVAVAANLDAARGVVELVRAMRD